MLRLLISALLLVASLSTPARATTVDVDKTEARELASRYLLSGRPDAALSITTALIQSDPHDTEAHIMASHAQRIRAHYDTAKSHAQRAWDSAQTAEHRYLSAMTMAQALSANGQKSAGQFWLRRAAEVAPNENLRARAIHDFRYVRDTNPWHVRFSFGARPSSNINNGARDNRFYYNGLVFVNPDAVPLSGVEFNAGTQVFYRPSKTERERLSFGLNVQTRQYVLSDSAKRDNPNAKASDYAYSLLEGHVINTWRGEQRTDKMQRITRFGASYGANTYGGDHLSNIFRLWGSNRFGLTERSYITASTSFEKTWRKDNALRDSDFYTLGTTYGYHFQQGGEINLFGRLGDQRSQSNAVSHNNLRLGLIYRPNTRIIGGLPSVTLAYEGRDYDRPRELNVPRRDTKYTAAVSVMMDQWDLYGFAPEISFSYSRNNSNVPTYETLEYGVNFGIRTLF